VRLFSAIELPAPHRRALSKLQQNFEGARWVPESNLHITLRFFGEVNRRQAEDLAYELQRIDMPSFEIMAKGTGQFSGRTGVKALWVGLAPQDTLKGLNNIVERASRKAGLKPERQSYRPHITIARFNSPPDPEKVRNFLERHANLSLEPFRISGFSLFSSELRKSGALYRLEADFPFSDAGLGDTPFFGAWDNKQA